MVNGLKALVIAAFVCAVSWPCMASANTFRLVPGVTFEHRSDDESGGEDYLARVHENQILYRPENRTLVINRTELYLNDSIYALLEEADLSEAAFYTSVDDESRLCIEFGFGGLLRSGTFQRIKGILVVRTRNGAERVVHYDKGANARCRSVGLRGPGQHR